jgi:hypothetical protein
MSQQVRLRRGTTAQHATFTGADGEVTFDTTRKCLVVHDGATPGGKPVIDWVKLDAGGPLVLQSIRGMIRITGGGFPYSALEVVGRSYFSDEAVMAGELTVGCVNWDCETLTYAASVFLDFSTQGWKDWQLAGNVTFLTRNLGVGRRVLVRIIGDGSIRNFTFPGGWRWVGGAAPASIAANKIASLDLLSWSGADAGVVARYLVEA